MPADARRRSGTLLLVAAAFLAISAGAFVLDGEMLPGAASALLALVLASLGAVRLTSA